MSALNLHLGDNADFRDGEFANVTYVGLRVSLADAHVESQREEPADNSHLCDRDLGRLASPYRLDRLFLSGLFEG